MFTSSSIFTFAAIDVTHCVRSPLTWALVCGALWLLLMVPRHVRRTKLTTGVTFVLGIATATLFGFAMPCLGTAPDSVVFYCLAAVTIGSAAAAISMKSAVYSAIWFAMSLVGTAGIFLLQGAQFLGVATIVVYAGAIVVTLLFVVMLAQPEGHDTYDRISWGWLAKPTSVAAAFLMIGVLSMALSHVKDGKIATHNKGDKNEVAAAENHMAHLGAELFTRHLLSVEVAGTLLMVALVGAIAIVIQGREQKSAQAAKGGGS